MSDAPRWQESLVVNAPPASVWAVVEDLSLIPEYHPAVTQVEFLSGHARRTRGARYKCVATAGRRQWWVEEVTAHEPFAHTTAALREDSRGLTRQLADFLTEISVEPRGRGQTLLQIRAWYRPGGWQARFGAAWWLKRDLRRRAAAELAGVKRLVERRAARAG